MKNTPFFMACCIAVPLLLAGCAATVNYMRQGQAQLEKQDYDAAIQSFELAKEENPDDPAIPREMGIAYYQKNDFNGAKPLLLEAFLKDTADGRSLFYLGAVYESLEDYPHAIDVYRRFTDVNPGDGIRSAVEARLTGLIRKQLAEEAKLALADEASINPANIPDNTVAVLYFKNLGKKKELDPIQKGLADLIITDLAKVKALKVVERVRMQKMLEEMGLGQTGMVDEKTSPRMGKLVGAAKLIQGSFADLAREAVRLDAGVVQVKPGKAIPPQKIQGKMDKFFQLEKDLVFGILDRMAVPLTQEEKDDIRIIPTENLLAFMAYCRGLDYEDRGMLPESKQEYQKAAELDPNFQQAKRGSSRVDGLMTSQLSLNRLEDIFMRETVVASSEASVQAQIAASDEDHETEEEQGTETAPSGGTQEPARLDSGIPVTVVPGSNLIDRMMQTAGVLDRGFLPGIDQRKPVQEQGKPSLGNTANIEIRVDLPEPPNVR